MPRAFLRVGRRPFVVLAPLALAFSPGCTRGNGASGGAGVAASAPNQSPEGLPSAARPTPVSDSPAGQIGPASGRVVADTAVFTTTDQVLVANGALAAPRKQLEATALASGANFAVRYTALRQLEATAPPAETLRVATELSSLDGSSDGDRWIAENAIACLSRLKTPEAQRALVALSTSPVDFKRAAARAVAGGR